MDENTLTLTRCPLCGRMPKFTNASIWISVRCTHGSGVQFYSGCMLGKPADTREDATSLWNKDCAAIQARAVAIHEADRIVRFAEEDVAKYENDPSTSGQAFLNHYKDTLAIRKAARDALEQSTKEDEA